MLKVDCGTTPLQINKAKSFVDIVVEFDILYVNGDGVTRMVSRP